MNQLQLFLPCAAGVEDFLADEVQRITGVPVSQRSRGGVSLEASWRDALKLNLYSRLAQRVLVRLWHGPYRSEDDLYRAAADVAWEIWFTPKQTIKVELLACSRYNNEQRQNMNNREHKGGQRALFAGSFPGRGHDPKHMSAHFTN